MSKDPTQQPVFTKTEGVRYTGSKKEIIPKILSLIERHCPDVKTSWMAVLYDQSLTSTS